MQLELSAEELAILEQILDDAEEAIADGDRPHLDAAVVGELMRKVLALRTASAAAE